MRRLAACTILALVAFFVACSGADPDAGKPAPPSAVTNMDAGTLVEGGSTDAAPKDAGTLFTDAADGGSDGSEAGVAECYSPAGAAGQCMTTSACAAIADRTSTVAHCASANDECCVDTPSTTDNPPIPTGYKLMAQSQVTPAMTTWAVSILHDPVTYRMFDTVMQTFGTVMALARVEWHPPDFQNNAIHRGVTLYEPM